MSRLGASFFAALGGGLAALGVIAFGIAPGLSAELAAAAGVVAMQEESSNAPSEPRVVRPIEGRAAGAGAGSPEGAGAPGGAQAGLGADGYGSATDLAAVAGPAGDVALPAVPATRGSVAGRATDLAAVAGPAGDVALAAGPAVGRDEEGVVGAAPSLPAVHFPSGSARIPVSERETLDELAQILLAEPGSKVLLLGHTDRTGSWESNQQLSRERARAVASALAKRGVASDRFVIRGLGQSEPAEASDIAKNRRVELFWR